MRFSAIAFVSAGALICGGFLIHPAMLLAGVLSLTIGAAFDRKEW